MSPNSMSMRRYILASLAALTLLLAAVLPISFHGIGQCVGRDVNACGLYRYEQQKIGSVQIVDTVFFGDSSAGNSIDARYFSELLGRPTLSLALNGTMGLPLTYVQMEELFPRVKVRHAVIMLSQEAYRHHFDRGAEMFVAMAKDRLSLGFQFSPRVAFATTVALTSMLFDEDILRAGFNHLVFGQQQPGECRGCQELDYVEQSSKILGLNSPDVSVWKGPYDDYDPFLQRIAQLCRQYQVDCLYMHGPVLREVQDLNPGYVTRIDRKITDAGLTLVNPAPIVVPDAEIGNAINHVRPDLRRSYTEHFFEQLRPFLGVETLAAKRS